MAISGESSSASSHGISIRAVTPSSPAAYFDGLAAGASAAISGSGQLSAAACGRPLTEYEVWDMAHRLFKTWSEREQTDSQKDEKHADTFKRLVNLCICYRDVLLHDVEWVIASAEYDTFEACDVCRRRLAAASTSNGVFDPKTTCMWFHTTAQEQSFLLYLLSCCEKPKLLDG